MIRMRVLAKLLKFGTGPDHDAAPASGIGRPDARPAHNNALSGEVGAFYIFHQVCQGGVGVIQHADGGVNNLPQGCGAGCWWPCPQRCPPSQLTNRLGKTAGEDPWLFPGLVKVGVPIHSLFFQYPGASPRRSCSVGPPYNGRRPGDRRPRNRCCPWPSTSMYRHGKSPGPGGPGHRRQTGHRGGDTAQYIAHAGGRLLKGLVVGKVVLIHGVEDTAVDRLQTVPHTGRARPTMTLRLWHIQYRISPSPAPGER